MFHLRHTSRRHLLSLAPVVALVLGCNHAAINDAEAARLAYLGLDRAVERGLQLGFAGFNAAKSANIPEQSGMGEVSGLMLIAGQVDQGASNNKGMRLTMTLTDYSDGPVEDHDIVYAGGPNALDLNMKGLPAAELTGSLQGDFAMNGALAGTVTLDLQFTGETEEAPDGTIQRKAGTIHVVGTATSDYGVFMVDVSL